MTKPMYGRPPRWWDNVWVVWEDRPWMVIIRTASWCWYDSVWRFNGGGYLGSADPYFEWTVGCVTVRKFGMAQRARAHPS